MTKNNSIVVFRPNSLSIPRKVIRDILIFLLILIAMLLGLVKPTDFGNFGLSF